MQKRSRFFPFIFGIILGVLCAIYLPRYVRPYLPESISGKETIVQGTVIAKERKGDALLVTVNTPQGALLATFKKNADEINLLVGEKDTLSFALSRYTPFIDDPSIAGVVKNETALSQETEKSPPPAAINKAKTREDGKHQHREKSNSTSTQPPPPEKKSQK